MIAVIYRFRLKSGREEEYKRHWQNIANYFREHRGAIGSCLHKGADELWYVYSLWPDEETRDNAWPIRQDVDGVEDSMTIYIERELAHMKSCVEEKLPELTLNMVNNQLMKEMGFCEEIA